MSGESPAAELIAKLPYDEKPEALRHQHREIMAARIAEAASPEGIEPNPWHHLKPRLRASYRRMAEAARTAPQPEGEVERLRAEVADLKTSVIAFAGPFAVKYAADLGLPDGHLHSTHYDILAAAGGRMDNFTRAALSPADESQ
jgi:hypothetical protein